MSKIHPTKQYKYLSDFKCLADKCPDNCCYGWNVNVDKKTYELWENEAPDLLELSNKSDSGCSIKKDPNGSGNCINLNNGLCNIEAKYGAAFLSNTCFFYPRVRYGIDNTLMLSAELSCPEITRLCLYGDQAFKIVDGELGRMPIITNLLQEGDTEDGVFRVNSSFINFCNDKEVTAEQTILSIVNTTKNLEKVPRTEWPYTVAMLFTLSLYNNTKMEASDTNPFHLLHVIVKMLNAAKRTDRKRLYQVLATIESVLNIKIDIEAAKVELNNNSKENYQQLVTQWQHPKNKSSRDVLKRYIQAELALNFFPYGGSSKFTLSEQTMYLTYKFAFLRLALMCHIPEQNIPLDQETIVKVVQGVLRYLNHSNDIALLISMCKEFDWDDESKLKGLLFQL